VPTVTLARKGLALRMDSCFRGNDGCEGSAFARSTNARPPRRIRYQPSARPSANEKLKC
jgi:hypothetical protein